MKVEPKDLEPLTWDEARALYPGVTELGEGVDKKALGVDGDGQLVIVFNKLFGTWRWDGVKACWTVVGGSTWKRPWE